MADKTVNINIKYNVDTSQVQKAESASNKAQAATDNLRKASDQFAKQFSSNNARAAETIAGLTLKMQQLKAQIELTSLSDTKRLASLSGQYKAIQSQVDAYNKSLLTQSKATKDVSTNTQNLGSSLKEVYTAVKLFLAAGLVRELVNMSIEMAKLSGNVEGVERAFQKQIPNSVGLLNDLRKATQNAVNDLELMQKALQAQNFGIDVQRLPELLEFAAIRAQQTGVSVDYLVNSIVTGIGRKSILILDNLGISATRLKEEFNGASLASQSVGEVTRAVADIAKEEMAKMGGYVETSATRVDQLTVSWHDLRVEISKAFTTGPGGGILEILKSYSDSLKALFEAYNRGIPVAQVFAEQQTKLIAQMTVNEYSTRVLTGTKEENIKAIESEIDALTRSIGEYSRARDAAQSSIKFLEEEIANRKGNIYVMEDNIETIKDGLKVKEKDALIDQETIRLLQGKLQALKAVNKEEKESQERDLVTDKVALFDIKPLKKKTSAERMLESQQEALTSKPIATPTLFPDTWVQDINKQLEDALNQVKPVEIKVKPYIPPYQDSEFEKAWEKNKEEVVNSALNNFQANVDATLQMEVDAYSERLYHLRNFYDEQQILAGDNKRAKDQLRLQEEREVQTLEKRRADREKKAAQAGILVNTALAIIKIFAGEGTYVDKLIRSAIMAGEGATQYAIASRARYYAKGEINIKGPGSESSDSIPAMLSKGESIMTAKQTREAFGILTDVRAGKLNDRVLKQLVTNGGSQMVMDDSRIVEAIKGQPKPPDLVRNGRQIYEVYTDQQNNKRFIRSKSI